MPAVFHGTMWAVVGDQRPTPLFGFAGTGLNRCQILDNGHLLMRGKEIGVFTDLATGDVLETWDNPWTGERVEAFAFANDRIGAELTLTMPSLAVGDDDGANSRMNDADEGAPFVLPWEVYGDEVLLPWSYAHSYPNPVTPTAWPRASTGPVINPAEHFTFFTSLAELADRSLPSAHFRAGFSRTGPWWPWMRMGGSGVDGLLSGMMFSRKTIAGWDDVPRPLLSWIERHHPDYLEPTTDWETGPILSTWEAFARETPPEVSA